MDVQVLIATMNQPKGDYSLLKKMNIQTKAIVGNQADRNEFENVYFRGHEVKWLTLDEHGVGLNRNNTLMRATGDIVLFADDDMVYDDDYSKVIIDAFSMLKNADVMVFNLREVTHDSKRRVITKIERIGRLNYLNYGTARIAVKLTSVMQNGIYFNQCFGGGTAHCHGEDNLFLTACLDKGLKIYAYPMCVASLMEERVSSWNTGYNEKYLRDQGILYRTISKRLWRLFCLQDAVRKRKSYSVGVKKAYDIMCGKS